MILSKSRTNAKFQIFQRGEGTTPWRWHLKAANGNVIAASANGFATRPVCVKNALSTRDGLVHEFQ